MLYKIIGGLWILFGILWLIKPHWLKSRMKKKFSRKMRRLILVFICIFGCIFISTLFKFQGILPKGIGIVGAIVIIKAIRTITSKASEKFFDWWAERPVVFFRIASGVILLIGVVLVGM